MSKVEFIKELIRENPTITDEEIETKHGPEIDKLPGILLTLDGLIWTARKQLREQNN